MKVNLIDVKFKIGNNIILPDKIFRLCIECGQYTVGYYDNSDGYAKRIEMVVPTKDVEIILPEVQEGKRGRYKGFGE